MPVADREEPPVLRVEALAKQFDGLRAVDGVSFDVAKGEIVGIIGPNGAGKTVLINLISGFYPATSGSVHLAGEDVTSLPLHEIGRRGIARTFQNIRLFRRMTVLENVLIADQRHARRPARAFFAFGRQRAEIARAARYLDLMGLAARADRLAGTLPYGEARRLEIARALATEPKLLMLDEPAAGMNEEETAELVQDVRRARAAVDAIVLIEHDMSLIQALSDRVVAMDYGRVMAAGTPAEVLADPNVQRAYLGEEGGP
ncbi:MAG: ABC transporter ATP-binding protein [Alphaproteobacteria bacterium]